MPEAIELFFHIEEDCNDPLALVTRNRDVAVYYPLEFVYVSCGIISARSSVSGKHGNVLFRHQLLGAWLEQVSWTVVDIDDVCA